MKKIRNMWLGCIFIILLGSCAVEPEPLTYGQDVCHFCKMTLMDNKFGGELVTTKGKVYKFDDLICMLKFYNTASSAQEEYKYKLVIDYSNPGQLFQADMGFYLKSNNIKSPMAGQLAAFEQKMSKDLFAKKWNAIYLTWGEAITEFK